MAPLTLPEAQTRFTAAAERFSTRVARLVHLVLSTKAFPRDEEFINDTAGLIRAADDYLFAANEASPATRAERADFVIMVAALRRAALVIMADINPDQAWFWTEEWQAGEREVDANIAAGRLLGPFTEEEFDAFLREARPDVAHI